jgi:3-oxoacyl-[acyl-carrier-protein] synthase II
VTDAGFDFETLDKDRAGVIWGSGMWTRNFSNRNVEFCCGDGTPKFNPFFIPKMISDIACGHISIKYGLEVPISQLFQLVLLLQMQLLTLSIILD